MDAESIRDVKSALAAFPGLAGLDVRISMADLCKAPTVADLDRRLDEMADARK